MLQQLGHIAKQESCNTYLVGGVVRDMFLGRETHDIDIMVEGDAITLAKIMFQLMGGKLTTHGRFNTATWKVNNLQIDLTSCRAETYDRHGALPTIKKGTIEDDLSRRDFTINAMALCINPDRFGELIDIYRGYDDLQKKLLRVLHDDSFKDDATRIMRAIRYEQRLGFKLERHTQELILRDACMLDTISGDRLRREVLLWLSEPQPEKILKRAATLGILIKIHPALAQNHRILRAFKLARKTCTGVSLSQLYFAMLLYPLNPQELQQLLLRLNIQGGKLNEIAHNTVSLKNNLHMLNKANIKPSNIYFKLKDFNTIAIKANLILAPSQNEHRHLKYYLKKLRTVKPSLGGKELIAMGVREGHQIGYILERLLKARLDGEIRTKEEEERLAGKLISELKSPGIY